MLKNQQGLANASPNAKNLAVMPRDQPPALSRRERQIMDLVYRQSAVTVAELRGDLEDAPSYSTVRALLGVLEQKGHVRHRRAGNKYVYEPTVPLNSARRSALRHLLSTFFGGSPSEAMAALLDDPSVEHSEEELKRMARMIREARTEGR